MNVLGWLVKGVMFALGFLFGIWLGSPDALHALGGWAAKWGDEIEKWEGQRDARLGKTIAREMKAAKR